MAYATIDEVQGMMAQFTISSTSKPSTTQATAIIDDIGYEVETHLAGAGVTVPVTEPSYFLGWLGRVNAYGAVAAILKSMFPSAVGAGETPAWAFWETRYRNALKGIDEGDLIPPGITSTSRVTPSTFFTRYPTEGRSDLVGTPGESWFTRSKIF